MYPVQCNKRVYYKWENVVAALIFVIALLLRLKMLSAIVHSFSHDAINYDEMTRQFLDTGVLGYMSQKPNAYVTPGYPLFLALIYKVFGYSAGSPFMQVRIIQAILGAGMCTFIFAIGRKLYNSRVGLIASAIAAIYPTFVWTPSLILTEVLYTFLFMLYIYIQIYAIEKRKRVISILSGIVFAMAVMVRPLIFPLIFLPFATYYYKTRDKATWRQLVPVMATVALVMLPWWIRNYMSFNKVIILATQTGNPLIAGTFPYFHDIDYSRYQVQNQFAEGIRLIWKGIVSNPILYLKWYTIGKFECIFGKMWLDMPPDATFMRSFGFTHYFIVIMGWVGAAFTVFKNRINIVTAFLILLTLMQLAFVPEPRYAYSLIPLLILLAAYLTDYIFFGSESARDNSYKII